MGLYPGDSPGNYVKGDVFMDLSVMNTELLQKNFKQMSHEMRRHLAMHLSFSIPAKSATLSTIRCFS